VHSLPGMSHSFVLLVLPKKETLISSLQRGLTPSKGLARFHNRAKEALAVRQ
jgi:uncharacterized membrane protein